MSPEERKLVRQFIEVSEHSPCMCPIRGCDECDRFEEAKLALEEALKEIGEKPVK